MGNRCYGGRHVVLLFGGDNGKQMLRWKTRCFIGWEVRKGNRCYGGRHFVLLILEVRKGNICYGGRHAVLLVGRWEWETDVTVEDTLFYWLGGENGKQMLQWKTRCFIGLEVIMGNRCYGGRHVVLLVGRWEWETDVTVEDTLFYWFGGEKGKQMLRWKTRCFIGWEMRMGNRCYGGRHVVLLVGRWEWETDVTVEDTLFYWLGGENGKQMLRWKTRCFIGWEVRMGNRRYGGRHVVLLVGRWEWETDVTVEDTLFYWLGGENGKQTLRWKTRCFIGWEVRMGNRCYGGRHVVLLVGRWEWETDVTVENTLFYWLGGENGKQMLRWKTRCFIGWEVRMGNRHYGGRHVVLLVGRWEWETDVTVEDTLFYWLGGENGKQTLRWKTRWFFGWEVRKGNRCYGGRHIVLLVGSWEWETDVTVEDTLFYWLGGEKGKQTLRWKTRCFIGLEVRMGNRCYGGRHIVLLVGRWEWETDVTVEDTLFYWLGGEKGKQTLRWKTRCFIGWEVRKGNRRYGGRHVVLLVWRWEWETDVTVEDTLFYWLGGENGKQMLRWKTRCFIGWEVRKGNRRYGGRHVVLLVGRWEWETDVSVEDTLFYWLEVRMGNRCYGGRHVVLLVGRWEWETDVTVEDTLFYWFGGENGKQTLRWKTRCSIVVCRLVYICINFCYTLGNHDYFLRNSYLSGKNVVAIFSVWSRSHFQHKMYKNMNITRKNWF